MHFEAALFFTLIGYLTASETSLKLLFPDERQYVYRFNAQVSSQTLDSKAGTVWTLEGRLSARAFDNYTKLRLHFLDFKVGVSVHDHAITEDEYLTKPWEVEYKENGLINSIYVGEEPIWATNLKRAISINFQILKEAGTYTRYEPCLHYACLMTYVADGHTVKKYTSYEEPTDRSSGVWSSVAWSSDSYYLFTVDTINTAERKYTLDQHKGLLSLDLKGSFQFKKHDHILGAVSQLSINYDHDLPGKTVEKLNLVQRAIDYATTDFSDPTNGIRNVTQGYLKNHTKEVLLKIARGIDADNIVRDPSLIHNLDFIELLNTLSQLKNNTLVELFDDLILGTSYTLETARNIFLEALSHARSEACAKFIKYVVLEEKEKLEDAAILSLIRKLPFNIAVFSQSLVQDMEVFTKLGLDFPVEIRHAGILSFASLLRKAIDYSVLRPDYVDDNVVKYFKMYGDCPQYIDRMIWLQGLCNIGNSAESYLRIIYEDKNRDRHERLWAAVAVDTTLYDTAKVTQSIIPILTNDTEHIQLRIVALHMFLRCRTTRESDFMFVHNYIQNSSNNQLKRFWYTTVKNVEASKSFLDYQYASVYFPFIVNEVSNPDPMYLSTNNYIISGQEETGSPSLQIMSIGDAMGGIPQFIGGKLNTGGRRPYKSAVYLIIEGVTTTFYRKMLNTLWSTQVLDVEKLVQVLKNMKAWTLKTPEKVHIDIVMKTHGKTVYATHMNQSRFDSINGQDLAYIEDFLRFGSHINQQVVYYPYQSDFHIPSELGTPIRLQSMIVSFTSIRGNLTAPTSDDLTWRNDLHIRYQGTSVTSLSTDGPIAQTAHTTQIQQSMVAHLPMKFNVSFSSTDGSLELTSPNPLAQQGGVAMHSRTQVRIESDSEKYRFNYSFTVGDNSDEVDSHAKGIFFDCDKSLTEAELFNKLLTSKRNSFDFLTSVQPSLIVLNTILLFTSPPPGSCGLILSPQRLQRYTDDVLQAKIQVRYRTDDDGVMKGDFKFQLTYFSLENPNDVFLKMEAITNMEQNSVGNTDLLLTVKGHKPSSSNDSNRDWTFCLRKKDVDHTPSQDISAFPASYEGHITMTYAKNYTTCFKNAISELIVNYKGAPSNRQGKLERLFEIKIFGSNISETGLLDTDVVTQTALGQLLRSYSKNIFNVTIAVKEKDGLASLSVNHGAEIQFKSDSLAWLFDGWTGMQVIRTLGLYRKCRITDTRIETLTGTADDLPATDCPETLALADCTDTSPRFAVIRYKNGIKIFSGGYSVLLKRENSHIIVDDSNAGDSFWISNKTFTKVTSRVSALKVHYKMNEIVVYVPQMYMNNVCGLCTEPDRYNMC